MKDSVKYVAGQGHQIFDYRKGVWKSVTFVEAVAHIFCCNGFCCKGGGPSFTGEELLDVLMCDCESPLDTDGDDSNDSNDSFDDIPNSEFTVSKTASVESWEEGVPFSYTIKYENIGSQPLTNVVIADNLPACLITTDPIIFTILNSPEGDVQTFVINVTPTGCADLTDLVNSVVTIGEGADGPLEKDAFQINIPNTPCDTCIRTFYHDNHESQLVLFGDTVKGRKFPDPTISWTVKSVETCSGVCDINELVPTQSASNQVVNWAKDVASIVSGIGIPLGFGKSPYIGVPDGVVANYFYLFSACTCDTLIITIESENGTVGTLDFLYEDTITCDKADFDLATFECAKDEQSNSKV